MKQFIHKSIAICMAFVVLMTTMSFTVDMHYCGNTMVDYSFFHNASTCKMEKAILTASCGSPEVKKKSCCSDEQLIIQGQDDLKDNFSTLTFKEQVFVAWFVYSYINLFKATASKEIPLFDYEPPYVKLDVQVRHQTFLI
jgi:hypothetical protein